MCRTCGCSDDAQPTLTDLRTGTKVPLSTDRQHHDHQQHELGHAHSHEHDHDHDHGAVPHTHLISVGIDVGSATSHLMFSRLTVGNPTSGTGLELKIIAAVVIGGGSLNGGRGTVIGTLTGALIMSVITNGCTMLGLQNPVQDMILGVIIVAAVTLDQFRQGRGIGR